MDALLTVAVVVLVILAAVIVVQRVKYKNLVLQTEQSKKDLIEKEAILQKEAMIKAKEALHIEREQLNEDERERRREFAAIENKLSKREDILEDKIQEVSDKELELDKLKDQLIEKEDFLAEIVQKQTVELERIAGMSTEEAKRMLLEQLKSDLAQEQMQKKLKDGVEGENLNLLIGSIPYNDEKVSEKVKLNILNILNRKYGIVEKDFLSAELELVPAFKCRSLGFDESLIAGYGQDDKVSVYTSLTAILKAESDGLKMQRALNTVITDEDLKRQSKSSILAAEGRINGLIQFINENNILTNKFLKEIIMLFIRHKKRRGWDSNPRNIAVHRISSSAP